MKEQWTHKRILVSQNEERRLVVTAGLHLFGGNDRPYFSVTAEETRRGEREPSSGGCMHKEVLEAFPQLKPVVDMHLADDRGWPMHAVENASYHAREGKIPELARHLGVDVKEAGALVGEAQVAVEEHVKETQAKYTLSAKDFVHGLKQLSYWELTKLRKSDRKLHELAVAESHQVKRLYETYVKLQVELARTGTYRHFFKDVIENHFAPIWQKKAEDAIALLDSLPEVEEPEEPLTKCIDDLDVSLKILEESCDHNGTRNMKVRLSRKENGRTKTITTPFIAGSAVSVDAQTVIRSLFSDADCLEYCANGEELQREFGYEDAREADRIYDLIEKNTKKLRKFLGDHYDTLRQPEM